MSIVNDDVWLGIWVIDYPKTSGSMSDNMSMVHWTTQISVSQQTKSKEWIRDPFREENSAYTGGYICKCIPHATDDHVLEEAGVLSERRLLVLFGVISFMYQLVWKLENCRERDQYAFQFSRSVSAD